MQHRLVASRGTHLRQIAPAIWLAGLGWMVLLVLSATGYGAVIRHDRLLQGGSPLWLAGLRFLAGWQVMLWAMMVPASLHAFGRFELGRHAFLFAAGYFAVWTCFGLSIFLLDAGLHATVDGWPWLAAHSWVIAGSTLVGAGTYQLSDLKARSLAACRELKHVGPQGGSAADGLGHGLRCAGASSGLMLLAFALTAGNLIGMAAITLLMVWEVTAWGANVVKPIGYLLIGLGVLVMVGPISTPAWWPA